VLAGLVLPAYGAVFLALCRVLGVPEARVRRFGRVAL
jgi:hypothetical protein